MKKYLTIAAGIFVSALLFVPIMEIADGNDYNLLSTDPITGLYRYKPNSSFRTAGDCYENTVVVNNLGFHGPPVSLEKTKGTFRIAILGSSYTSATQVPIQDMFSTILQEKLNADPQKAYTYEVIPNGIGTQSRMYLDIFYYLSYISPLKPDLVIDIESDHELLDETIVDTSILDAHGNIIGQPPKGGESPASALARSLSRHAKLLVDLYNRALVFNSNLKSFLSAPFASTAALVAVPDTMTAIESAAQEQARWQGKEKMLNVFATRVKKDGAQFVYATWSGPWTATSTAAEFTTHGPKIAAQNNFNYVDLVSAFLAEEAASGKRGTETCDPHWNADGNRYVADALFSYLTVHPALLSRKSP